MTPLRVGNKSRFSTAIAAMEKKSTDQKSPPKTKDKSKDAQGEVEEADSTASTATNANSTPKKRGRKKGNVKRKIVVEEEERQGGSGEENVSPFQAKRKKTRMDETTTTTAMDETGDMNATIAAVSQEQPTSPRKRGKSKKVKGKMTKDESLETNEATDATGATNIDVEVGNEEETLRVKSAKIKKGKSKDRGKSSDTGGLIKNKTMDGIDDDDNRNEDSSSSRLKNRVLVERSADENLFDKGAEKKKRKEHAKIGKKEKKDKAEKKTDKSEKAKKGKVPPTADNEDRDESKIEEDEKDASETLVVSPHPEGAGKSEDLHSRRKNHPAAALDCGKSDDSRDDVPSSISSPSAANVDPERSQCHNDREDKDLKSTEDQISSPRPDDTPSSPTFTSKLSSPQYGFSSPHPHHQPPTMLSPTGDQPPLKLKLSINKVFQAKLEGTASSTSVNSSDGEQSGAESESVCAFACLFTIQILN